ncbi:MerR family transcriptional regulator [Longimycelium tulufanense]|uniref:MerR family transcriptional regulator n=1 Tax=Longimycelium tulufanense TaxID=907463 RepID=UPI001663CD5F|nr:MerR family transcriptional regulator [Longimycelium tulufanense]
MPKLLLPTGVVAKKLGVSRRTVVRWWKDGLVTPELVTAGGQARWLIDDLLEQLRAHTTTHSR